MPPLGTLFVPPTLVPGRLLYFLGSVRGTRIIVSLYPALCRRNHQGRGGGFTLPAHPGLIPCPLAALPEAAPFLPHHQLPAEPALLGPVMLLARAEAADHAVRVLVGVRLGRVVAPVARVYLAAAREAEPAVAFGVMRAAAAAREFLAGDDAERLGLGGLAAQREQVARVQRRRGHEHEFRFGDLEGEAAVAVAAHGDAGGVAAHGDDAGAWDCGAAGGAGGHEGAGEHVGDGAAGQVDVAGADGVGVHENGAVGDGERLGAFRAVGVTRGGGAEIGHIRGRFATGAFN